MNSHLDVEQTLPQIFITSGFNNHNVYKKMGQSYEKRDDGDIPQ